GRRGRDMLIVFESLRDLALKAFSDEKAAEQFKKALKYEKSLKEQMFVYLVNGEEDILYHLEKTDNSRCLFTTWTRSSRKGVAVQETVWLCDKKEKTVTSLSHENISDYSEINSYVGEVRSLPSDKSFPLEGYDFIAD
ncbi:MAG: hypothetical protein ACI4CS_04610, partial [Candidatus Weimeria sp.]